MKVLKTLAFVALLPCLTAWGDEWAAELPVGSSLPSISATDQHDRYWNNDKLLGGTANQGLVLFFIRSTVW